MCACMHLSLNVNKIAMRPSYGTLLGAVDINQQDQVPCSQSMTESFEYLPFGHLLYFEKAKVPYFVFSPDLVH